MAVITPTVNNLAGQADGSIVVFTWVLTTANTTGVAVQLPEWADKTFNYLESGDVDGGATVTIQGARTDVDANYGACNKADGGTAFTFSGALPLCKSVIENPVFIRPKLTVPGTAASITISLTLRRAFLPRQ